MFLKPSAVGFAFIVSTIKGGVRYKNSYLLCSHSNLILITRNLTNSQVKLPDRRLKHTKKTKQKPPPKLLTE